MLVEFGGDHGEGRLKGSVWWREVIFSEEGGTKSLQSLSAPEGGWCGFTSHRRRKGRRDGEEVKRQPSRSSSCRSYQGI